MNSATQQVILASAESSSAVSPGHLVWLLLFGVIGLALLALFVRVLASIITSDRSLPAKLLWILFAFWLPVLTWALWYTWGRPRRPDPAL